MATISNQRTLLRGKKVITYNEYLQSKAWATLRARVFRRDKYRCVLCNGKEGLQAHHRTYKNIGHEKLEDLYTLCFSCHAIVTSILRGRKRIKRIENKSYF